RNPRVPGAAGTWPAGGSPPPAFLGAPGTQALSTTTAPTMPPQGKAKTTRPQPPQNGWIDFGGIRRSSRFHSQRDNERRANSIRRDEVHRGNRLIRPRVVPAHVIHTDIAAHCARRGI